MKKSLHQSSYEHMADLVTRYLAKLETSELHILDIGACDVNGCYQPLFSKSRWRYQGVDVVSGSNVDIVLRNPYHWQEIKSHIADLIISGQTFEHIEYFWLTWLEMVRVLKPGGFIFLIAPSRGPEHPHPVDCWRFYPEGLRALAKYGRLEMVEVSTDLNAETEWGDTVGVFYKPANTSILVRIKERLCQRMYASARVSKPKAQTPEKDIASARARYDLTVS